MSMGPINPLAGILMGGAVAQASAEKEKTSQIRRRQIQERDIATRDDELEHQVESSQQVDPASGEEHNTSDQRPGTRGRGKPGAADDSEPAVEHLDITA
jgi:hypothetical protein